MNDEPSPPGFARIEYRNYWDVPRLFVVYLAVERYYLTSRYEEGIDDYNPNFEVFRMHDSFEAPLGPLDGDKWDDFEKHAVAHLGTVPVRDVRFRGSHRRWVKIDTIPFLVGRT